MLALSRKSGWMRLIYSLMIVLLLPFYGLAQIFSRKIRAFARSRREGRRSIVRAFSERTDDTLYWMHGASVGELDQALGVARELKARGFSGRILITAFSLSVKKLPASEADYVGYLPLDFPWAWRIIKKRSGKTIFITFTWDVYPNLLHKIRSVGGQAYLCSAALPEQSWRLKYSRWLMPIYSLFNGIGVVDQENRDRFLKLTQYGNTVKITGDSRYDTIFYKLEHAGLADEDAAKLKTAQPLLILASTYHACDEQLLPPLNEWLNRHPDRDVWVFPHHVSKERIGECSEALRRNSTPFTLYSEMNGPARVVLVDRLGLLARSYERALYCYVGGGFHHRIHNTAEPAALGTLVLTGPRIEASPIAMQLEARDCLYRRHTGAELFSVLSDLEQDNEKRLHLSEKSRLYLESQRGASGRFIDAFLVGATG